MKKKIERLKKKGIKNMTDNELKFVIENDKAMIAYERINYTSELLKRAIQRGLI